MKTSNVYLRKYGLKRVSFNVKKEIAQVLTDKKWEVYYQRLKNGEEIEEVERNEIMKCFFEDFGCLKIENLGKFSKELGIINEITRCPKELLDTVTIYRSGYFDAFLTSLNGQQIENLLRQGHKGMLELTEEFAPEFKVLKIFNFEETIEKASEEMDIYLSTQIQNIFHYRLNEVLRKEYVDLVISDVYNFRKNTIKNWDATKGAG